MRDQQSKKYFLFYKKLFVSTNMFKQKQTKIGMIVHGSLNQFFVFFLTATKIFIATKATTIFIYFSGLNTLSLDQQQIYFCFHIFFCCWVGWTKQVGHVIYNFGFLVSDISYFVVEKSLTFSMYEIYELVNLVYEVLWEFILCLHHMQMIRC